MPATPPMLVWVLLVLPAVLLAVAVFARTRSLLRAGAITAAALTGLLLAGLAVAWVGYRGATAALLGASPSARVVLDPGAAGQAPGKAGDATARAWRLWLDGELRVEPEPAFLAALRWLARAAPERSLDVIRELSPHEPSV